MHVETGCPANCSVFQWGCFVLFCFLNTAAFTGYYSRCFQCTRHFCSKTRLRSLTHNFLFICFFFLLPHYVSSSKFLFVSRLKKKRPPSWVKIHNRKKSQTFPPQKTTQELVVAVYWAWRCGHFLTTWVFFGWKRHQKTPEALPEDFRIAPVRACTCM